MNEPEDVRARELDPDGESWRSFRIIEALLFASARPLDETELRRRLPPNAAVSETLADIERHYRGRGVNLVRSGRGWAFRTAPDLADRLQIDVAVTRRLSKAAVETLTIIAYHQPATRSEVENIRGVSLSRGTIDILLEADWIRPAGRRRTPGRPLQWRTTEAFLEHFGLDSIADLPDIDDLRAAGMLDRRAAPVRLGIMDEPKRGADKPDSADAEALAELFAPKSRQTGGLPQ